MARIRSDRRGVILLVVLALLALFSVITLTFVLVSSQAQRTAAVAARQELRGDPPQSLVDLAMLQVLRGSNDPSSVIGPHSLLEDMYGNDASSGWFVVWPAGVTFPPGPRYNPPVDDLTAPVNNGPVIAISAANFGPDGKPGVAGTDDDTDSTTDETGDLSEYGLGGGDDLLLWPPGKFTGCWITFTSGALKNQCFSIIDHRFDNASTLNNKGTLLFLAPGTGIPEAGASFIINGRPFNGTGFGSRVTTTAPFAISNIADTVWPWGSNLNAVLGPYGLTPPTVTGTTSWPYALMPNPRNFAASRLGSLLAPPAYLDSAGHGGADESYDAKDFQNMILARPNSAETSNVFIPSLHDPALINYWYKQLDTLIGANLTGLTPSKRTQLLLQPFGADYRSDPSVPSTLTDDPATGADQPWGRLIVELKRKFIMRPMREDNPKFTGSNNFVSFPGAYTGGDPYWEITGGWDALTLNQWDVDNDGDGIPDSIWVDLGFPAQTMPDGRRYKPLGAIMVLDLDGRLNLNAHGNNNQLVRAASVATSLVETYTGPFAGGAPTPTTFFAYGQGYGPADINLRAMMTLGIPASDLKNLLLGRTDVTPYIDGRYGEAYARRTIGVYDSGPAPGMSCYWSNAALGQSAFDDDLNGVDDDLTELGWVDSANWPTSGTWYMASGATMQYQDNMVSAYGTLGVASMAYQADDNFPIGAVAGSATNVMMAGDLNLWPGEWGSPPDLDADGSVVLDLRGQPKFLSMGEMGEAMDDPYELNLTKNSSSVASVPTYYPNNFASVDAPFTAAELECLLRPFDLDSSSLPHRITQLAPSLIAAMTSNPGLRYQFTTEGWDVPGVTGTAQQLAFDPATIPTTKFTMLQALREGLANQTPPITGAAADHAITRYASPELLSLGRIDINRPFGDGIDNDADGNLTDNINNATGATGGDGIPDNVSRRTVDDPLEAGNEIYNTATYSSGDALWRNLGGFGGGGVSFDHNNDGNVNTDAARVQQDLLARHYLARQLYLLAMSLRNPTWRPDVNGDGLINAADDVNNDGLYGGTDVNHLDTAAYFAQWSINIVDFRDRDSIMTPFEYDPIPFPTAAEPDGWSVDGILNGQFLSAGPDGIATTTGDNLYATSTDDSLSSTKRALVWGCERPELLLTETLALHNRNTDDLNTESRLSVDDGSPPSNGKKKRLGTPGDDEDFDQQELPEGSLFIEVYNPWPKNWSDPSGTMPAEMTAFDTNNVPLGIDLGKINISSGAPVWRMVVTHGKASKVGWAPDELPAGTNYKGDTINDVERAVYFTSTNPTTAVTDIGNDRSYWMSTGRPMPLVAPGRFAVIGPAPRTALPDGTFLSLLETPPSPLTGPAQNFSPLSAANARVSPYTNNDEFNPEIRGIIVDRPQRLSVSEPVGTPENYSTLYAPLGEESPGVPKIYDEPIDRTRYNSSTYNEGGRYDALHEDATTKSNTPYRFIHLQRLANPLLPFNATWNPYITIDTMLIDLTVYDSHPNSTPSPDNDDWVTNGTTHFDSLQRSFDSNNQLNLWSHKITSKTGPVNDWVPDDLEPNSGSKSAPLPHHTLGFLNESRLASDQVKRWTKADLTTAYTNTNIVNEYIGAPKGTTSDPTFNAFPWLVWNNRPFVSEMELMLVPTCRASQLAKLHSISTTSPPNPYTSRYSAYHHLPNFFDSAGTDASHLYRILDYLHVPSRFSGVDALLDPVKFSQGLPTGSTHNPWSFGWAASGTFPTPNEVIRMLRPPFNRLPLMREPGRVNLNTILTDGVGVSGSIVWDAISGGMTNPPAAWTAAPTWANIALSRRGYVATTPTAAPFLNDALPTMYANPFRAASDNQTVPLQNSINTGTPLGLKQDNPIDVTMLRAQAAGSANPMFALTDTAHPYQNTARNPAFHYQLINRMRNSVTTRSNVYAVWITIGYFEVESVTPSPGNPDGLALGAEVGSDTGEIKRHRGFYLIDRTRPTAFERGENHNVENAIILRRYIE